MSNTAAVHYITYIIILLLLFISLCNSFFFEHLRKERNFTNCEKSILATKMTVPRLAYCGEMAWAAASAALAAAAAAALACWPLFLFRAPKQTA